MTKYSAYSIQCCAGNWQIPSSELIHLNKAAKQIDSPEWFRFMKAFYDRGDSFGGHIQSWLLQPAS